MFELVQPSDKEIEVLYRWKTEEKHHELYSCRPVNDVGTYEEFYNRTVKGLEDTARKHLVLRNREHYWIDGERYDQYVYSLLRREWEEGRLITT